MEKLPKKKKLSGQLKTSMPLKTSRFAPGKLKTMMPRLTRKDEAKQRLKDLAVPTKAGIMRSILSDQKKKKQKKAGEEWSRLRREKPSSGIGVGY